MIKTIILKNNFISRGIFCPRAHYKTYIKEKQTKQFQHQQGRHQSLLIACGSRGGGEFRGITLFSRGMEGDQLLPTRPKRGIKKIDLGVIRILQSLGGEEGRGPLVAVA